MDINLDVDMRITMAHRDRGYAFICGCPRSGTTALWQLMVAHPGIVMGVERYVLLAYAKGKFKPELFEPSAFFEIKEGETFYKDASKFSSYYDLARKRFDDAIFVGDKSPNLYLDYDGLDANFENVHIFYIVRNVIDVAGSYQRRARDTKDVTWNARRDFKVAVSDWNQSLQLTLKFAAKPNRRARLHIIGYEDLFMKAGDIDILFSQLNLNPPPDAIDAYKRLGVISGKLEQQRGDQLTSEMRHYICLNAAFGAYRQVYEQRLRLALETPAAAIQPA